MDSMTLFIASLAVSCIGALASVLLIKADNAAKTAGCLIGAVAAVLSFVAGIQAVLGDVTSVDTIVFFPFAHFQLLLNQLSGLFVALISVLAFAGSIYGLNYFDEYPGKKGRAGFFFNTFVASMMLVITADNVFWFLVAFELMSLTSYFLVVIEENENSIHGGWLYFVIAHVGFVLIMASFLTMTNFAGGSFAFADFRATQFSPAVASVCFVLAFFGFGAKAGIIPLHGWLPKAHPEAPSNVSALMSGGMIKIGIFGILKVGLDLLSASGVQVWWGLMVMVFGAISSVLGVAFALQEHDIKRLLAYHSVENIGIILLGVGASMAAMALNSVGIAVLALMAALYHTFNHAMFKGELFLGAGALLYSTGTRNMEKMGGLFRRMPATAICFLIGALAISAIPPFNGFVSEWFTYQSLFNAAMQGDKAVMIVAVFAAVALAITGALAVTCFVKAYGVSFASAPRSEAAANAKEVPAPMVFAQGLLAAICVVLGIGAPVIAPVLVDVAASVLHPYGGVFAAEGMELMNQYSGRCHLHARRPLLRSWCSSALLAVIASSRLSARCRSPSRGHAAMLPTSICPSWLRPLPPRCPGLCSRSTRCATVARPSAGPSRTSSRSSPVWPRLWSLCPTRFSSMPRIRVSRSSPTSRLSSRAANYSIYICYIVAALVVFLVLAVQMG